MNIALAAIPWLVAVAAFGPGERTWQGSLTIAAGAALVHFMMSTRSASTTWVARIRTNQASQIWIGGLAGAAAAFVLGRLIPIPVSAVEIVIGAALATLAFAVVEEYQLGVANDGGLNVRRAAIIGTGEEAAEWVSLIADHPEMGIELVGCIGDETSASRVGLSEQWLGSTADMLTLFREHSVDLPIVAVTSFRRPAIQPVVDDLLAAGHDVAMTWGVGRLSSARLTSAVVGHETLPLIRAKRPQIGAQRVKRAADFIAASLLLLLGSPIVLAAAIAIKLETKGPAFFRQERVGLRGDTFRIIKLRSMKTSAEDDVAELSAHNQRTGPLFKMKKDPRVTKVGRILRAASFDELPQLVNVIRGEMSLVGPRPALVSETKQFDQELCNRSDVRPGLTGLWQVEARSNEAFGAYRRLDLHYLDNWSLALDLRIMVATAQMLTIGTVVRPFVKRTLARQESAAEVITVPRPPKPVAVPDPVTPNAGPAATALASDDDEPIMLGAAGA